MNLEEWEKFIQFTLIQKEGKTKKGTPGKGRPKKTEKQIKMQLT